MAYNEEMIQAGDRYGKEMKDHENNGYSRGYQDASAFYQKLVSKLTDVAVQKYSEGYNNGYGDGYDVSNGLDGYRLNPPNRAEIARVTDELFKLLEEAKPTQGHLKSGG